jgi:trans-aconitate methyltransferase
MASEDGRVTRPIGESFDDPAVVAAYAHRPPYPPALYARLLDLTAYKGALLDIGCGPGKLAGVLAPRFQRVDAIDISPLMIEAGRAACPAQNIRWQTGPAETARLDPPYDLAVAGASLHWMDHDALMPRLARALAPWAVLAIVGGDAASPQAEWHAPFMALIRGWVKRLGGTWNSPDVVARNNGHVAWFEQMGHERFTHLHTQSLESLIAMEHSRATWTHARMGEFAAKFDEDLRRLLTPYACDGMMTFPVTSSVTWGRVLVNRRDLRRV